MVYPYLIRVESRNKVQQTLKIKFIKEKPKRIFQIKDYLDIKSSMSKDFVLHTFQKGILH